MRRRIVILAVACLAGMCAPARADVTVAAGTAPFRCLLANGYVTDREATVEVCFSYGPSISAGSSQGAQDALTSVDGFMELETNKGADFQRFDFDPTNPSNPRPSTLTNFIMDPTMSTATLVLNVGTITASLGFTADIAAPDAWHFDNTSESVEPAPLVCLRHVFSQAIDRTGSFSGTMTSSTKGGGAFMYGSGDVWQGWYEYGLAAASTNAHPRCGRSSQS